MYLSARALVATRGAGEELQERGEVPGAGVDHVLNLYETMFNPGSIGRCWEYPSLRVGRPVPVGGRYPTLGRWRVATNVIFLTRRDGEIVTGYPEGVHHVTTMRDLFPIAADVLERKENLLLILDETQNFLHGEHNGTPVSTSMKVFMGIIRKFNMAVWLLSPATRNMGPSFRNFIDDGDDPGNVNAQWPKDEASARKLLAEHGSRMDPRNIIFMKLGAELRPEAATIPRSTWTTPPEDLKEGHFCYDHKASAEFSVGDGFDFRAFVSATGDVSSFEMVKTIRGFYESQVGKGEDEEQRKSSEEVLVTAACRVKSMGLTDESISRAFGIPATTLRRKSEQLGMTWTADRSEGNPDRYRRVKGTEE